MLQLLSPLALICLAALAVPVILHLWRRPMTTVRVGTLRFFSGSAIRRATNLRWHERLLLFVRLLLLALLVLLLAQPIWKKRPPARGQRWILVSPGLVLEGEALKRWRDLEAAGFETRELASGFPVTQSPKSRSTSVDAAEAPPVDAWSLLREADARLPAGSRLAVFSSDWLALLRGQRPAMQHCHVEWVSVPLPDDISDRSWLDAITMQREPNGAVPRLRAAVTVSNATRTHRVLTLIPAIAGKAALPGPLAGWSIEIDTSGNDRFSARLVDSDDKFPPGPWLEVSQPKPLNVAILHGADRLEDARYLQAAVRSVGEFSEHSFTVQLESSEVFTDVSQADWIFWLNDFSPSPALLDEVERRGANLLCDAENSRAAMGSPRPDWLIISSIASADDAFADIRLLRRTPAIPELGASIWRDGFGTPLLTVASQGRGRIWKFFSRFHPEWNDLPRSSALPAAVRSLFSNTGDVAINQHHDRRHADSSQVLPTDAISGAVESGVELTHSSGIVDLHTPLWILCGALFALERALSYRSHSHLPGRLDYFAASKEPILTEPR